MERLKTKGIVVDGSAESRDAHEAISKRFDPAAHVELAFVLSKPLSEIIRVTNKGSINLYARCCCALLAGNVAL